ncbi:hypothetical protein [Rhizobium grahamii]|nr:hypothetical protein [Rhizobium grahamii]
MSLCGGKEIGAGEGVGKREPVGVERKAVAPRWMRRSFRGGYTPI